MSDFKLLWAILSSASRKRFAALLFLTLIAGVVEVLGVGLVIPFIALASNSLPFGNASAATQQLIQWLVALGVPPGYYTLALGLLFLAGIVVANVYLCLFQLYAAWVVQKQRAEFSSRVLRVIAERPMEWLDQRNSAELIKLALSDVSQVTEVANSLIQVLAIGARAALIFAFFLLTNLRLALAMAIVLPLAYVLVFRAINRPLHRAGMAAHELSGKTYRYASELLNGVRNVRVSGSERRFLGRYDDASSRLIRPQVLRAVPGFVTRAGLESVTVGAVIGMLVYFHFKDGSLTNGLPLLSSYAVAGIRLLPAMQQGLVYFFNLKFLSPALQDIAAVLAHEAGPEESATPVAEPLLMAKQLEVKRIEYAYQADMQPVLADLSLQIRSGDRVALVGSTGAGKSTLFDMLLGLRSPDQGTVSVDGQVLTGDLLRRWRVGLGYVPQSIYLLDASIAENVAFGLSETEIDNDKVIQACQIANIHDFINTLPDGYQTIVGERGVRLSGGQIQRLGIARALYKDPAVVFFDEATSSLDSVTENSVLEALDRLKGQKTLIVIAHRLNTVWDFDRLYLLQHGRLIAQGTSAELMENSPEFRELARHQVDLSARG